MSATQTQTNGRVEERHPGASSIAAVGDAAAPGRVIPPFKYADLLDHGPYGDFRDELVEHGYVVVKNVMTQERAAEIRSKAFGWLESFGRGFDRNKPETFGQEFLPKYGRGGMYPAYGVHHEQWVWDCRLEPGVKAAFAKLWGTDKLVSSFDGGAIMMPFQPPMTAGDASWHHIDLNPSRVGFHCAQGIVNLNENGPDDGGLVVMKGSSKLMKEFFDVHGRPPVPAGKIDTYGFKEEDKQWFFDRGCEWLKVCAGPGDLILWRSDTMHQGMPPSPDGKIPRVIAYVCMVPAECCKEEDRAVRADAWEKREGTSHAPHDGAFNTTRAPMVREDTGLPDPDWHVRKTPVRVTDEVLRLAGQLAYD